METRRVHLAPVSQQIVLACLADPASRGNLYIESVLCQLKGHMDDARMETAFQAIVDRQESLRTTFRNVDGVLVTTVSPPGSIKASLEVIEIYDHDASDLEVSQTLNKIAERPFNLAKAPLARIAVVHVADNRHLLLLCYNHCIMDGESQSVFFREFEALYNGDRELPPLQHQYSDFAALEKEQLESNDNVMTSTQIEFWKSNLSGAPPVLDLPGDYSRPPVCSYLGRMITFPIEPETRTGILEFMAKERQSLLRVMLTAFSITLSKYGQQQEVIINVPRSLRKKEGGILGNFVNTLPIRLSIDDDVAFKHAVKASGEAIKEAVSHGDVTFEQIVNACCSNRSAAYSPIAQVLITVHHPDWFSPPALDGLVGEACQVSADSGRCINDLTIRVLADDNEMKLQLMYNTEIFSEENVARLVDSFLHVLAQAVKTGGEQPIVDVLGSEHRTMLQDLSLGKEKPAYVTAPLTHEAFAAMAAKYPDRQCLCYEGEWLSYGEVNKRARAFAKEMRKLGVGPGVVVGLMLDRSFELVISMLAVFYAGGAFLPCDPSYPDDRLAIYLEDGAAIVVLAQSTQMERTKSMVTSSDVHVIDADAFVRNMVYDGNDCEEGDSATSAGSNKADLQDPAYIIFTSGSTGRPKGVVINHLALIDLLEYNLEYYAVDNDSVSLLSITINFDPSIMQIFTPLIIGAGLVIARPGGHVDAEYIANLMLHHSVSFYNTVPSLGLEYYRRPAIKQCTSLKSAIFSGEAMPMELVNLIHRNAPQGVRVYNAYGPTEATVMATNLECPAGLAYMTIGRPEHNMHAYIVDSKLRPVPVGVAGELLLSGLRLAVGYAGRPDLTADKFVPNPCLELVAGCVHPTLEPYYEKAYRTGDLCRWRRDGNIDFMGRIDRQTKVNGVRIELGEVEAALEGCDGVVHAVAAAIPDPLGQKRLVGYVTPGSINSSSVLSHCRSVLVPAMVPSVVVVMDSFPLLLNGKVDVKGLPQPDWSGAGGSEEYVGPDNEIETTVQRAFAEVLHRSPEELSVLADFFAAGGTSLQVFRAVGLLQSALGLDSIPATLIHNERTARGVAKELSFGGAGSLGGAPIIAGEWPDAVRPLPSNQEQMWILSSLVGSAAYNMPAVYKTGVCLDNNALQAALDAVAGRHEVLRTRFQQQPDGTVVGLVVPSSEFHVPLTVCEVEGEDAELELVFGECGRAFDLESEPLLRALVLVRKSKSLYMPR